jgi:hypothetical protein
VGGRTYSLIFALLAGGAETGAGQSGGGGAGRRAEA